MLFLSSYLTITFLACRVTFKIMFYKLATKIYDLATTFFLLVASWLLSKKVNFEPCVFFSVLVCLSVCLSWDGPCLV